MRALLTAVVATVKVALVALTGTLTVAGTLAAPFEQARWLDLVRLHLEEDDPRVDGRGRAALFDRNRFAERVLTAYRDLVTEDGWRRNHR